MEPWNPTEIDNKKNLCRFGLACFDCQKSSRNIMMRAETFRLTIDSQLHIYYFLPAIWPQLPPCAWLPALPLARAQPISSRFAVFSQPVGMLAIFKHKLYEKYVKSSKPTKNVYSCILGKHELGFKCRGTCDGQLFNCVTEKKKK